MKQHSTFMLSRSNAVCQAGAALVVQPDHLLLAHLPYSEISSNPPLGNLATIK